MNKIDYMKIEEEFHKLGKDVPLKEEERNGLTKEQLEEINPCGTYCSKCDDYGVVCDGCRNRKGTPIWYHLYDKKEVCEYYRCCENKGIHNCSECSQLPCDEYFVYPDPNMSDELKQWWFKLRMENFNELRSESPIGVEAVYKENVKRYVETRRKNKL